MTNATSIRQEIFKEISLIPDEQLSYLLELIRQMKVSNYSETHDTNNTILHDPLANFIGAVKHGNLAQNHEKTFPETKLDDVAGCLNYQGEAKTIEELDYSNRFVISEKP